MGPRCSCMNREDANTFYFNQNLQKDASEKNTRAKGSLIKNTPFDKEEREEMTFRLLTRLQGLARAFILRNRYKKYGLKSELQQEQKKLVEDIKRQYRNENTIKAEEKYPPYDPNGWTKFYIDDRGNIDYGKLSKIVLFKNETLYIGEVNIHNQKNGHGELLLKDGTQFIGSWFNNQFQGFGRLIDAQGNLSEGIFNNNLLNGKGSRILLDDSYTYTGDFVDGIKEGEGVEDCPEYLYEGTFRNDMKEGKGKLVYKKTNDTYEGDFSNNDINGFGFYVWASNNHTYKGTFKSGKMNGKGTYTWPDGGEYYGDYINNVKEGRGIFKWPNGREFDGPFANGKPHGVGMLTVGEKKQEAEFLDGKLNKGFRRSKTNIQIQRENEQKGGQDAAAPNEATESFNDSNSKQKIK